MAMRVSSRQLRSTGRVVLAVSLAMALAAAGATSSSGAIFPRLFGGGQAKAPPPADALQVNPNDFATPGYCPELHLQLGGEAYAMFERDHQDDAKYVRYLGSINQTARECHSVTDTSVSLKVGVAGHVIAGPKGVAGKITMPIKVTVVKQRGNKVLFSKTYPTAVTVGGAELSGDFSQVIDPITFKRTPDDEDLIIYVGFDQGKTAT